MALHLALDGSECSASCLDCFTPSERTPVTQCIRSWVGQTAGLGTVAKRKIPASTRNQTLII